MAVSSLKLRKFSNSVGELPQSWFEDPIQSIPVVRLSDYSQTADGACRVSFGDQHVGFVKPRPDAQPSHVVANEKIASDLAFLLHIPVAPVIIRSPISGTEWSQYTAMSLACLAAGRHWGDGPPILDDYTAGTLEALRTFWTWIADLDHNGHPHNLLYQRSDQKNQLLAIDHSYAFGFGACKDPMSIEAAQGYGVQITESARNVRNLTIAEIEGLNWSDVSNVVRRLEGKVIPVDEATRILGFLEARRRALKQLMNVGANNG
jgi:hypothetical protein